MDFFGGCVFCATVAHDPPTAALFPVASLSYSELSFGVKTKTRVSSV